jgi:hypothetical protein
MHMFLGFPDPDPDPLVKGIDPVPDFGSGSGSFYNHANSKRNLDSYYYVTLFDFLSFKNDVNVPSKSDKQKFFV